jgi:hypothetical protein
VQLSDAIGVHGGISSPDVQLSRVHFGDVSEEYGRHRAISRDNRSQFAKQRVVTKVGQDVVLHASTSWRGSLAETQIKAVGVLFL